MKIKLIPILLLLVVGATGLFGRDQFPDKRPKHAHIYCDTGILSERGGNKWKTTAVKLKNGEERYYDRVAPDLIDGKYYYCDVPPSLYQPKLDSIGCKEWPTNVLVGKTRVRVIWWWGKCQGEKSRISDEIFSLPDE